jgi:hypothetical protein
MKFFRIDLLTLLISLFILNSCKNQNTIGLDNNATGQINGTFVSVSDTSIVINTVPEDSVSTTNLAKAPFGYFNDPVLGTTQIDLATDLNLPNGSAYTLPAGTTTIDSAVVLMYFADGFYGSGLESTFVANVYQLNENFNHSLTYYSNKVCDVNYNTLLGSSNSFNAATKDSVTIQHIIAGAPDTPYRVAPHIRIKINPSFVNTYLFNANSTTLNTNTIFQNSVKGLYVTIDKSKTTGAGGIFMIKGDSLAVYYKSAHGTVIDTGQVTLPMSSTASAIKRVYTPAVKAAINSTSSNKTVYLQGPAGLKAKISFPNLLQKIRNALPADSDILLNRAELVITPNPGTIIPFAPLPKITMYTLDIANVPTLLQDAASNPRSGGLSAFGGFYTSSKQDYHFLITAFLQDLLFKRTKDYGTYIAPVDTTNTTSVDYLETPQVAARSVIVGTDKTSSFQIVLNVIYTKIRVTTSTK